MRGMTALDWYKVEQLPWPVAWTLFFGRPGPLVMEIGFGSGLFLTDLAKRRPEANVVGVEIAVPSLRNAARKVRREGLANVRLLQGGAAAVLQALCEPESVDTVIINYPDPWPKKDQLGRRLIDDAFLRLLATRLRPGGALDIATDHDDYAAHITGTLRRAPHFESRLDAPFVHADDGRVRTKYEQVALDEGRTPRYYKWRRNDTPAEDTFPIPKELPMPHVVLRLSVDTAEIGRRFRPREIAFEGARVRFVEAYQSLHDGKLLIETYINEDPIRQRIGLEVRARAAGDIVIALAEVGFPRPTAGVHLAIGALVEWLRDEFPSLVVVQTTLQGGYADVPHQRN